MTDALRSKFKKLIHETQNLSLETCNVLQTCGLGRILIVLRQFTFKLLIPLDKRRVFSVNVGS